MIWAWICGGLIFALFIVWVIALLLNVRTIDRNFDRASENYRAAARIYRESTERMGGRRR